MELQTIDNTPHIRDRVILKTADGQVVVRPRASSDPNIPFGVMVGNRTQIILNPEGVMAWNNGEDITGEHYNCIIDVGSICKMDLT